MLVDIFLCGFIYTAYYLSVISPLNHSLLSFPPVTQNVTFCLHFFMSFINIFCHFLLPWPQITILSWIMITTFRFQCQHFQYKKISYSILDSSVCFITWHHSSSQPEEDYVLLPNIMAIVSWVSLQTSPSLFTVGMNVLFYDYNLLVTKQIIMEKGVALHRH